VNMTKNTGFATALFFIAACLMIAPGMSHAVITQMPSSAHTGDTIEVVANNLGTWSVENGSIIEGPGVVTDTIHWSLPSAIGASPTPMIVTWTSTGGVVTDTATVQVYYGINQIPADARQGATIEVVADDVGTWQVESGTIIEGLNVVTHTVHWELPAAVSTNPTPLEITWTPAGGSSNKRQ